MIMRRPPSMAVVGLRDRDLSHEAPTEFPTLGTIGRSTHRYPQRHEVGHRDGGGRVNRATDVAFR